ncbi:M48 family metalloprotease [Kiloniella sp. b19]|uniref:M48 family metalloprotease n=1 Tax=Kiloniella sp. GXU_MW_B19 TaxID=3141326 RepID=UPI0031D41CEC
MLLTSFFDHLNSRSLFAAVLLLGAVALTGCSTSDATGRSFFNGGLTPEKEQAVGREQHPQIIEEFGGIYDEDPELTRYVNSLGQFLAQTSETPNQKFTFTILDSPVVNAFALPGGYVYVTRGLMALANNEAELAGVIAHEIGHVTARHSAERYGSQVLAQVLSAGVGILTRSGEAARAASTAGGLAVKSFSRDQEFEADLLGVRYLSRARFDPEGMGSFLGQLQANSVLDARIAGVDPAEREGSDITRTHPRTADRIQRAISEAGTKAVSDPIVGRDVYLKKIDGMLYGDAEDQGYVRDETFSHKELGITFTVPEGFRLINSPRRVIAEGPDKAVIVFDSANRKVKSSLYDYLVYDWGKDVDLDGIEAITVNGLEGYTASTRVKGRDFRLVVIRMPNEAVYRFRMITQGPQTYELSEELRRTTYSFRALTAREKAALKPLRIRLRTIRPGDTINSLVARMDVRHYARERFLVINDLPENAVLETGQLVKLIQE